jgi:uncharacterized protein (UPF0335 family)
MTQDISRQFINQLVSLYTDEQDLAEQIKSVKDDAKDKGLDPSIISAVAKAIVKDKVSELEEKSANIISAIKSVHS